MDLGSEIHEGEFLKLKNIDYVQPPGCRARAASMSSETSLPNSLGPILVTLTFGSEGPSFQNRGFPFSAWGSSLGAFVGQRAVGSPEIVGFLVGRAFPGFMIFMSVLSYNLLGDALRDALDPKEPS